MANEYFSLDNLRFLLHDVHDVSELFQFERFQDYDKEGIDMLLDAARQLADKEMYPYFTEMDEDPVRYEEGKVISHPQLQTIIREAAEGGWIGASASYDHGGMQLPEVIFGSTNYIFQAANNSAQGYLGLTAGAARLITSFGSQELIDTYVEKMYGGEWQGTMALTEPQAGSSLSDIKATAKPMDEGHYLIDGQKIFISAGDHQACNNFVHLVLARIDGAPLGTKGISLFVVPKYIPQEDGSLEYNDVLTAADFKKMGQKGYATTHLVFGDKGHCKGFLVGEAHRGLSYMFQMMNEARLGVGTTAIAICSAAYYASLKYAKERPQGRPVGKKDVNKDQILIIEHPDVKRMLLTQKAIFEGAHSLAIEVGKLMDLSHVSEGEAKEESHLLLELLTPILKTYPSEAGQRSVSLALQVLGGYGFTMDFPLQQYYRDMRIMSIYEGTTGIQSLDLLGRKVTMQNGKAFQLLAKEMMQTISTASNYQELVPYANMLKEEMARMQEVVTHLLGFAMKGDSQRFIADATIFMEMASLIVIAWQWLKQGVIAQQALLTGEYGAFTKSFYEAKVHTLKVFYKYELPHTVAQAQTLMDDQTLTLSIDQEVFV